MYASFRHNGTNKAYSQLYCVRLTRFSGTCKQGLLPTKRPLMVLRSCITKFLLILHHYCPTKGIVQVCLPNFPFRLTFVCKTVSPSHLNEVRGKRYAIFVIPQLGVTLQASSFII